MNFGALGAVLFSILTISACSPNGSVGVFGPRVVAGNEHFVTVHDPIGFPNASLNIATQYCSQYGKAPVFQSQGGDHFECSGNRLCNTYQCKQ